jgi:hypothetical protein
MQGRSKHTVGCPTRTTNTRFPKVLGWGSNLTVSGTRLSGIPHTVHPASHMYPSPGYKAAGDYSRLVIVSSRTVSLRYYAYRSHFRQVLSTFKSLDYESHWTGAQITCSYHMSQFQHTNLFSRVTNITRLLPGPIA